MAKVYSFYFFMPLFLLSIYFFNNIRKRILFSFVFKIQGFNKKMALEPSYDYSAIFSMVIDYAYAVSYSICQRAVYPSP